MTSACSNNIQFDPNKIPYEDYPVDFYLNTDEITKLSNLLDKIQREGENYEQAYKYLQSIVFKDSLIPNYPIEILIKKDCIIGLVSQPVLMEEVMVDL